MWKMYESISIYFEEFFISNFETFLWWLLYVFLNLTNHLGSILCFLILIADPAAILQNWPEDFNGSYFIWSLGNMQFWNKFQCIFIIFSWFHLDNFLFFGKNAEFWEFSFLTQFVLEFIRMNLHASDAPFWNEISVSNLLILSNL